MAFNNAVWLSAALVLGFAAARTADAQAPGEYPTRAVRIVVPFTPGGATDVIARMVGQKLQETWGQSVIIDNRAGATGAIGSELVAKSAPDGYTLLMGTTSTHSVLMAVKKLPYTPADFTPVTSVATFPNMLVIHPSVPARNLNEFIALLKANPGKYYFGSSGNGSSIHLSAELFKQLTGTQMTHVPYKGSSQALTDLLAGTIQVEFDNMTTVWPAVKGGKLRALGVTTLQRLPIAPDIPAIAETLKGFEAVIWVGFYGPAGLPPEVAQKIAADTRRAVHQPDVAKKLDDLGATPVGNSPAEFAAYWKSDLEKWGNVWKATGLTEKDVQ